MKKKIFGLLAVCALFTACTKSEDPNVVKSVTIKGDPITIATDGTRLLEVEVQPSTATYDEITWASEDKTVATVSRKGLLTAVKAGKTTITATINGVSGSCKVTVVDAAVKVTGVKLDKTEAVIAVGERLQLNYELTPENASIKTVSWATSDAGKASVDRDGVVTGVAAGEAKITVTTDDGGFTAECTVKVSSGVDSLAITGYSETAKVVAKGSQETLAVEFFPKAASDKTLEWTTSDNSIATVESEGEGMGKVTFSATKTGAVTVTATSKANAKATASQSFFVKGEEALYIKPEGTIYAGRKAEYSFNTAAYGTPISVKWTVGEKEITGTKAQVAVDNAGENTIIMEAAYGKVVLQEAIVVNAEQWYIEMDLPDGLGANNCTPVFSKDCKYAYFVTQGTKRCLVAVSLEERKIAWSYEMPSSETTANNGGNLSVNPLTGDIVCPSSSRIYCISKDGAKKWETDRIESNTTRNPTMYSGCGACFSNDCSVVFMCCTPRAMYAFKASDGTILDKFSFDSKDGYPESNQCQMAVYGDNNIVVHLKGYMAAFFSFDGSKFTLETTIATALSGSGYPTDLSSCAVTSDQSTVFFGGYAMQSVSLTEKKVIATANTGATKWHMAPSLTEDGHMYLAVAEYQGTDASVLYLESPSMTKVSVPYSNAISGVDGLKFSSVPCDSNGNAYFCFWDKDKHTITFYQTDKGGQAKALASTTSKAEGGTAADTYQGCFNFCDGYLVAVTGGYSNPNYYKGKLLVRCVDAQRAHSWSGHGGDVCSTKNANLVYATK